MPGQTDGRKDGRTFFIGPLRLPLGIPKSVDISALNYLYKCLSFLQPGYNQYSLGNKPIKTHPILLQYNMILLYKHSLFPVRSFDFCLNHSNFLSVA